MNILIKKTIKFLFPIILVLFCIELFYQFVPNNYTVKAKQVTEKYNKTKVLILGNSHTFYGLNPTFFSQKTYNFSNVSQTIYFDQLLFDKHIQKFKNLKYVILNVEYFSLSEIENTDEDAFRKYYYSNYMNLEVPIVSKFDIKNYLLSSSRNLKTNLDLVNRYFSKGTIVNCNKDGFGIDYYKIKNQNLSKEAIGTMARHEDNLQDFEVNIKKIQAIINTCKEKNIKVIVTTMPVSRPYSALINESKLKKIFFSCNNLKTKNSNVYYLNLFNDRRFSDNDFFDPDHLHFEGAKKCSLIMNEFINSILKK
jgi:Protein of unknown function (DUF1574)